LLQKRPVCKLLKSRLLRLVPPLLVTSLFIAPISLALFQIFQGKAPSYVPQPGHLWFVWNLTVYFILAVPLLLYVKYRPDNLILRLSRRLSPYGWLFLLPGVLTLTTWFLEPYITLDMFAIHFIRFWYGFACFLSGVVLVSLGDHFWQGIRRVCHVALPAALVLYLVRMAGIDFEARLPGLIVRTMESAYGMLAFLGYGSLVFSSPSRLFMVVNRGVFAVYIIHLPLQQAIAFFLFRLELNAWLAFALHLFATLSISALIYMFVLRPMRWLHPFFGIAPLKPDPSHASNEAETTPLRSPWPVAVGRFATLYVVSPLLVLVTMIGLVALAIYQSRVTDDLIQAHFQREIVSRSPEENRAVAEGLVTPLKKLIEAGDAGRAKDLAREIQVIMAALESHGQLEAKRSPQPTGETNEAGSGLAPIWERFHREIASRSPEENRALAEGLLVPLTEAMQAGNAGRAKNLSLEIRMIMEALDTQDGNHQPSEDPTLGNGQQELEEKNVEAGGRPKGAKSEKRASNHPTAGPTQSDVGRGKRLVS